MRPAEQLAGIIGTIRTANPGPDEDGQLTPPTQKLSRAASRRTDRIGAAVLIGVLVIGAVGVTLVRRNVPPKAVSHLVSPEQKANDLQAASEMASPEPNWLLRNAARFGVTKVQRAQLQSAADLCNLTIGNAQAERTRLTQHLNAVAREDPAHGHRVLSAMRDRDLIMMTEATFSMARNTWWQRATAVLTPRQAARITKAWYAFYVMGPTAVGLEHRERRSRQGSDPKTRAAHQSGR